MQYELFLKSNFSHKCINISTVVCMFFYTYQRFLVIFLDCAVLALHSACKNSLSSYQTMGSRNSRLFKFGHSVVKTQSPLTASRWEAKTSPGMAKASLPSHHRGRREEIIFLVGISAAMVLTLHPCHLLSPLPGLRQAGCEYIWLNYTAIQHPPQKHRQ